MSRVEQQGIGAAIWFCTDLLKGVKDHLESEEVLVFAFTTILLFGDALAKKPPELRLDKGKPISYELNLDLDPSSETFSGTVRIAFELDDPSRSLWLHASGLDG